MRIGVSLSGVLGLVALIVLATGHGFAYTEGRWPVAVPQPVPSQRPADRGTTAHPSSVGRSTSKDTPLRPMHAAAKHSRAAIGPVAVRPRLTAHPRFPSGPSVARLRPYTSETNYLSLPAYLRLRIHEQTGRWVTYKEAAKMLESERLAALGASY